MKIWWVLTQYGSHDLRVLEHLFQCHQCTDLSYRARKKIIGSSSHVHKIRLLFNALGCAATFFRSGWSMYWRDICTPRNSNPNASSLPILAVRHFNDGTRPHLVALGSFSRTLVFPSDPSALEARIARHCAQPKACLSSYREDHSDAFHQRKQRHHTTRHLRHKLARGRPIRRLRGWIESAHYDAFNFLLTDHDIVIQPVLGKKLESHFSRLSTLVSRVWKQDSQGYVHMERVSLVSGSSLPRCTILGAMSTKFRNQELPKHAYSVGSRRPRFFLATSVSTALAADFKSTVKSLEQETPFLQLMAWLLERDGMERVDSRIRFGS